jgi:hypothetical protein
LTPPPPPPLPRVIESNNIVLFFHVLSFFYQPRAPLSISVHSTDRPQSSRSYHSSCRPRSHTRQDSKSLETTVPEIVRFGSGTVL